MKKEVFIERAVGIHGDRFDYSLVPDEFTAKTKIEIICKLHGNYFQTPHNHLNGKKCKRCADIETSVARTNKAKSTFLERANKAHNYKYDYSKFVWESSGTPATITCPYHGDFGQSPANHLTGRGCSICALESRREKNSYSKEQFVELANKVHKNMYNYSKVNYYNSQTKVDIICAEHGIFKQIPNSHLRGNGCPSCKKVGFSPDKPAYFYILKITEDVIKFGITSDMSRRVYHIQRNTDFPVEILYKVLFERGLSARALETEVKSLVETKVIDRYLLPDGYTETTHLSNFNMIVDLSLTYKDQFL